MTTTVHLIFNSHLDPVWLWTWDAGLDAAVATCRSACDRLDEYPEMTFSFGDAWALMMLERADSQLFSRIKGHVASGRWSLYGGWWVQPDCNIPTKAGFEHQISLGREFLESRFGKFTDVARNVDSFGHTAALPDILAAAGQPNYIMMRPGEHEMKLPARVFKWQGFKGSPSVLTFRIADPYCWSNCDERALTGHILNSTTKLPEGISDTMCFVGVGDHGGGPTKRLVDACLKLSIPGVKLKFSTPERYFQTIRKAKGAKIPTVAGELQFHAIGCYTLQRSFKLKARKAELLLSAVESSRDPKGDAFSAEKLRDSWRAVCFNQFHDTMGGTCLPSAYEQADAQVGGALAFADEELRVGLRRRMASLSPDKLQRIVLQNPLDRELDGHVEFSPWMDYMSWTPSCRIIDEKGRDIPFQRIPHECVTFSKLLFRAKIAPKGLKVLRVIHDEKPFVQKDSWSSLSTGSAVSKLGFGLDLGSCDAILSKGSRLPAPELHLIDDPSDTWTHNFDRYLEGPAETPQWSKPFLLHKGPLAAEFARHGRLDGQELRSSYRLLSDEPFYELSLDVNWLSKLKVLKLVLPLPAKAVKRLDGTCGGRGVERALDGSERPLSDWLLLELEDGSKLGVVCPDVMAVDVDERRLRLTLLRSPLMANHLPAQPAATAGTFSDHGVHKFRIGFDYSKGVSPESLLARAMSWSVPPLAGDLTKGMPPK